MSMEVSGVSAGSRAGADSPEVRAGVASLLDARRASTSSTISATSRFPEFSENLPERLEEAVCPAV
jgi:hypothetical protein